MGCDGMKRWGNWVSVGFVDGNWTDDQKIIYYCPRVTGSTCENKGPATPCPR